MSVTASPFVFLLFLAVGIERDVFEKFLQAVMQGGAGRCAAVEGGDEVLQVAHAVLAGFGVLFGAAEFGEVAGFVEEGVRPGWRVSCEREWMVTTALTLTLSPRERGQRLDGFWLLGGTWCYSALPSLRGTADDSPSPGGEGRGEGGRSTGFASAQ